MSRQMSQELSVSDVPWGLGALLTVEWDNGIKMAAKSKRIELSDLCCIEAYGAGLRLLF